MKEILEVTIVTINVAGGARDKTFNPQTLGEIIIKEKPDIIGVQEAVVCWNENKKAEDSMELLSKGLQEEYQYFFIPYLDSKIHSHEGKWKSFRFKNFSRVQEGDGIFISPKYQVMDFWSNRPGQPVPVIISEPNLFLGNRDTEPRQIVITKVKDGQGHVLYFAVTHLTTLRNERDNTKIYKQGSEKRYKQIEHILHILAQLPTEDPIILVGDFNTSLDSSEMEVLQKKFFPITKLQSDMGRFTHIRHRIFVDHIFFSPKEQLGEISEDICYLLDPKGASDHKPVVAKLKIYF